MEKQSTGFGENVNDSDPWSADLWSVMRFSASRRPAYDEDRSGRRGGEMIFTSAINHQLALSVFLTFAFWSPTCPAEIFKWIDADGNTHFSDRRQGAGANLIPSTAESRETSPGTPDLSAQYWKEQERQFRQRQISREAEESRRRSAVKKPKSLSGGTAKWADTDAWRCNLARDIISGAVRRGVLQPPIDQYDIKLAKENVRVFCH